MSHTIPDPVESPPDGVAPQLDPVGPEDDNPPSLLPFGTVLLSTGCDGIPATCAGTLPNHDNISVGTGQSLAIAPYLITR